MDELDELEKNLAVRYVKLYFTVRFLDAAALPRDKTSALRGGMGEMLLRSNCVRDRNCENCDFAGECLVRRMMYSKFEKKPAFVTTGESVGYIIECEDQREFAEPGDTMEFQLLLFGKSIVYFSQFLIAFSSLGMQGLGKEKARFQICAVKNSDRIPILSDGDILMRHYTIKCLEDYVDERLQNLEEKLRECGALRLQFVSPLSVKFRGEMLREFSAEAIVTGIKRRLYMLGCYENLDVESFYQKEYQVPEIVEQDHVPVTVKRVSYRHNDKIFLHGLKGFVILEQISDEVLHLLLAGELIHVGQNTSFGFGRYRVIPV